MKYYAEDLPNLIDTFPESSEVAFAPINLKDDNVLAIGVWASYPDQVAAFKSLHLEENEFKSCPQSKFIFINDGKIINDFYLMYRDTYHLRDAEEDFMSFFLELEL